MEKSCHVHCACISLVFVFWNSEGDIGDNCIKFTCHCFLQNGRTALMFAAQNGHNEAVKILVQHGAGVDMQDVVSTLYCDIQLL